jgi:hypothetical protein
MNDIPKMNMSELLKAAIVELAYVSACDEHSLCASSNGEAIIKRGMELLGISKLEE